MKQAWKRLGTPDAISWVAALLLAIQQIAGSLTAPFVDVEGREWEFIGLRILAVLCMFAVLGAGKLLLRRVARTTPRPLVTLLIFAVTVVAGTVTFNALLVVARFTTEWNVGRRLLVAIPGVFTILIVTGILVAYARELARRNQELAATATELERAREDSSTRIEQRKNELVREIRSELESALNLLDRTPGVSATANLNSLIDDVVRPMSYELSGPVRHQPIRVRQHVEGKVSWYRILESTLAANPARPLATTLWLGALVGMFLITGTGLPGLIATLALCALSFAILTLTRLVWRFVPQKVSTWGRALIFSSAILVVSFASAPAMTALSGYSFTGTRELSGWLLLSFFMSWTVTLVFGVTNSLTQTNENLSQTVDNLKRENAMLNNSLRSLHKDVSRALHGPVQEAIASSIRRLQTSGEARDRADIVADLRHRINAALQFADRPGEDQADLDEILRDLAELWEEVVDIRFVVDDSARESLRRDKVTSTALTELIHEGCTNAIRHADAAHISITVTMNIEGTSTNLTISNDGKPLTSDSPNGLGSQIFDERCVSWSRFQAGDEVRVEATIPTSRAR